MSKIILAQLTRFDKAVQEKALPSYYSGSQQRLFPDVSPEGYKSKGQDYPPPEKYEAMNLEYPELKPDQISTTKISPEQKRRIDDEIDYELQTVKNKYQPSYSNPEIEQLKSYLEANNFPDVLKGKILAKYEKLRAKSIEFYQTYQQANQLAQMEYTPNTDGTYAELFQEFGKLATTILSQEIGRLFGIHTSKGFTSVFKNGINIFNITALNYERKIRDMNEMINAMNSIML